MTNETNDKKPIKVTKTVRISTKKSILIKYGLLQFFSLFIVAIAIVTVAIIFTHNKAEAAGGPEDETTHEVRYVEVEKPVEKIVEKEIEIKVVDQEAVKTLANEMAQQLFEELKNNYTAQADEKATEAAIEAKYEELKNSYTAQVDSDEVLKLATEKANELFEEYKASYVPETIEVEKIIEKTVTVEVPVEKIVEVEKIIEKEVPVEKIVTETVTVEVPVEKIVEVEKIIEVVDQEATQALATEMAQQMFTILKDNYTAQVDTEATEKVIEEKYNELKETYIAQADAEEVLRLATEMANQMLEEYKVEYAKTQEAARVADLSTIYVHVYGGNGESNSFYLAIEGSLYDRLTYAMIYEVLKTDARFEGYKVRSITNKDAVEVFVGENYTSTRAIRIELK